MRRYPSAALSSNKTLEAARALQEDLDVLQGYVVLVDVAAVEKLRSGIAQCNAAAKGTYEGQNGVNSLESAMRNAEERHDACRSDQVRVQTQTYKSYYKYYYRSYRYHWHVWRSRRRPRRRWGVWRRWARWRRGYKSQASLLAFAPAASDANASCDDIQHELELSFCDFRQSLTRACLELDICRSQLTSRMTELGVSQELLKRAEVWRKQAFTAETRAQCFLDSLSSATGEAVNCGNLAVDTSHLDLPFPGLMACNKSAVEAYPCGPAWVRQYYGKKPWNGSAVLATCTPCQVKLPDALSESPAPQG